ncbi:MAG: glutathione S-transferase [Paracoccaceae bacterium]|jgi:glutathione S-transferase
MLKLVYFKMRALAEAPQLLLNYCKINYEYIMSWDHFDDEWSNVKPKLAFKQLPMMEVEDGTQICQSIAILQYIENLGGLKISDPVKAAEATAVLQSAQELFAPLNPTVNFAVGQDFNNKRDSMRVNLESRFSDLARYLDKHEGRYFIDDTPRAAEFACFHHLDLSRELDPEILKKFPRLIKFVKDIEDIDTVSKYLKNRPELVGVGTEPKLVINGTEHPTGVNKT